MAALGTLSKKAKRQVLIFYDRFASLDTSLVGCFGMYVPFTCINIRMLVTDRVSKIKC